MFSETKPPKIAEILLKVFLLDEEYSEKLGDYEECFNYKLQQNGVLKALIWYWIQVILAIPVFLKNFIYWRSVMIKNYFLIAFRLFTKQKIFSTINIVGLAIGLTACLLIYSWVQDELNYDQFHSKAEQIYRVEQNYSYKDWQGRAAYTSGGFGPALVKDYPEVAKRVRLWRQKLMVQDTEKVFYPNSDMFAADKEIFEIFDFELEEGNKTTALENPYSIVITKSMALKYLNTLDVVGKTLPVKLGRTPVDFKVTGLLRDVPANSHVHFNSLFSMSSLDKKRTESWGGNFLYTYVLLNEGVKLSSFEQKFPEFMVKYKTKDFQQFITKETTVNDIVQLKLIALKDIHLDPSGAFEIEPQGNMNSVIIFSSIAVLILLIACINFMNLSTARANKRAKEIGMRKAVGANKKQLVTQLISESLITATFALFAALILSTLTFPLFNEITGKELSVGFLLQSYNFLLMLVIVFVTGLLSGLYPAFYLSTFNPAVVLKGSENFGKGKSLLRKIMVVFQFSISAALIIGTLVIVKQMQFIKNKSLGYDKENIVLLPVNDREVRLGVDKLRNALKDQSIIKSVAASSQTPADLIFSDTFFTRDDTQQTFGFTYSYVDYDFVDTYGLQISEGRNFSKDRGEDVAGSILVNEIAAKRMGFQPSEALGKKLNGSVITGVLKDFNFKSLHIEIEPILLILQPNYISNISIKFTGNDFNRTLTLIKEKWEDVFPGKSFSYKFLDDQIELQYESDLRTNTIITIFSSLSIFIACLGLFGLAAFTTEEKRKEIGIRKILGAKTSGIALNLSNSFIKWILIANLIAWPVAYYFMESWLNRFVYHTTLNVELFITAGFVTLIIALVTVSFWTIKAAVVSPIRSIKEE